MTYVEIGRVPARHRADVERRLAMRYRLDDGSRPSETLREMLERDRFSAKAITGEGPGTVYGLLMRWPSADDPSFLPTVRALWVAVDLPVSEWAPRTSRAT